MVAIDHTRGNRATLSWLLYDGHGNLVRTMAPDYTLSDWQFRGVWGEVQGTLGAGRGYCANLGHPEDETGLVYMRARYYEPATGRFISEDPARDGVNWYLYADGNPVGKVDENGENAESVIAATLTVVSLLYPVVFTALFNPMVRALLIAWASSMLVGLFIGSIAYFAGGDFVGLIVYEAPWIAGGALYGYLAADHVATEMYGAALRNLTLQGQVKEFYKAYGELMFATMAILFLEWVVTDQ